MTATWASSTVGEQFDVQLGKMLDSAKNVGVPKPYLGNRAVQWGRIDVAAGGMVPLTPSDLLRYRLKEGDLLVCEGGEVGRAAIWRNQLPECYFQKVLHRLRPKKRFDARVMQALLQYWSSTGAFSDYVTQTSIAHLPREKFIQMPLPLPPVAEQRAIGDALADADRLIATLEGLIVKRQAIKRGMMQQLLTGRTRLPGFDSEWRRATIGSLSDQHRRSLDPRKEGGRRFQHFSLPAFDDGEMPVDQFGMQIDSIKFVVPQQAILVSKLNPRIPRIWAPNGVGVNAIASTEFVVMTPKPGIDRLFLMWLMKSDAVTSRMKLLATGTTGSHARIHPRQIAALEVVIPEEAEQVSIATILDEVSHEIGLINDRLVKARAIKTGMMQQLLTGRTRLPVEVSS